MAPPVNGLVGSTAMTPTVSPASRVSVVKRSTSVLFPAPGGPVTPTRYVRPVCGKMSRTRPAAASASSSISEMARAMARTSPARTRSAMEGETITSGGQQLPGNHEALHLACAFTDGQQLDVTEILLGRIVLHEAVAAVHLHAVLGGAHGDLARIQLRHGGLEGHAPALIS